MIALLLVACTTDVAPYDPGDRYDPPPPGVPDERPTEVVYPDLFALQELAIHPTCSLNNGVCHNSNNYPDLHTPTSLVELVGEPCGVEVDQPELLHDECEPPGDHLVVGGFDGEILSVEVVPADAEVRDLTGARIRVSGDTSGIASGAEDVTVTRGAQRFDLGAHGASVVSIEGDIVVLELEGMYGEWSAKQFLDARALPWHSGVVRVGDPNGNGIAGGATAMPLVRIGEPLESFLIGRLVDPTLGELMPRQCRTWDDRATRALACWIEGLVAGESGITNAYDPIDYENCSVELPEGRCAIATATGIEAVNAIVASSCGGTGCHIGETAPGGGLDLTTGAMGLLGRTSEVAGRPLVVPGDPASSYLLCKLNPACSDRIGMPMPSGGTPLVEAQLEVIRAWIEAGAT
jgi:hypothetical protein